MEVAVKGKQAYLYCAVVLSLVIGLVGCKKDDSAAVNALQELTTELSNKVAEQNGELSTLAETLRTCKQSKAKIKEKKGEIKHKDPTVDVPSLEGEASVESLGAWKQALSDTLEKQETALAELKAKAERCANKLDALEGGSADGEVGKKGGGKKGEGKKGKKRKAAQEAAAQE
jgi:chromosome segregation ATPase